MNNSCSFTEDKIFMLVNFTRYKTFCKNIMLRGCIFFFLYIILQWLLCYIGHLDFKKDFVLDFWTFLVFWKKVILWEVNYSIFYNCSQNWDFVCCSTINEPSLFYVYLIYISTIFFSICIFIWIFVCKVFRKWAILRRYSFNLCNLLFHIWIIYFLCKLKLFIFTSINLHKKFCENVLLLDTFSFFHKL